MSVIFKFSYELRIYFNIYILFIKNRDLYFRNNLKMVLQFLFIYKCITFFLKKLTRLDLLILFFIQIHINILFFFITLHSYNKIISNHLHRACTIT